MTEIRNSKTNLLIILILFLPIVSHLSSFNFSKGVKNEIDEPKSSGFWVIGPLHIDESGGGDYNWTEAAAQPWCSGSGTLLNPYIIVLLPAYTALR